MASFDGPAVFLAGPTDTRTPESTATPQTAAIAGLSQRRRVTLGRARSTRAHNCSELTAQTHVPGAEFVIASLSPAISDATEAHRAHRDAWRRTHGLTSPW